MRENSSSLPESFQDDPIVTNDPELFEVLRDLGVDVVFTDQPDDKTDVYLSRILGEPPNSNLPPLPNEEID